MKSLLPKKEKYINDFAKSVQKQVRQLCYGLEYCEPTKDLDLASIRFDILGWQSNEDNGALCETSVNYKTWLPVNYRNDSSVDYNQGNVWGPGFINSENQVGPKTFGIGYVQGTGEQNILEINTAGCLTRINLNPAINYNTNMGFEFVQSTPSTVWIITHNMGMNPNVRTEDLSGGDIVGIIDYIDNNRVKIYFSVAIAGKAYLS